MTDDKDLNDKKINFEAWCNSAVQFIRSRGLELEFTDWCGGWAYPAKSSEDKDLLERLRTIAKSNHSCGYGYEQHEFDVFMGAADALEAKDKEINKLLEEITDINNRYHKLDMAFSRFFSKVDAKMDKLKGDNQ